MTSFHAKLLSEDALFNRSHPMRSSSPNPIENLDEDDGKAMHIANLQKEYNRRLTKPLQINSRLKMQTEAAIGSLSGQFMVPKHPLLTGEDTERKYLVNQVKELDRISAYHDKEAGIAKPKKRKIKQKSILEQHLDGDLYNYIKAVKDKAAEIKKAQIAAGKMAVMTEEGQNQEESHYKDPKQLFHKQLDVIRAEKDKHLKPKQLNTNSYFRYSERKMLLLRSIEDMESVPKQDKSGMAFFRDEAKKEKMRRRPIALLTKKSISFKSHDKSNQSALNLQSKPSQDLGKLRESPIAVTAGIPKNVSFYKAYDLMGVNKGSRNLDIDSNEYTTIPSPEIPTPTEAQRAGTEAKAKFFGFNLPLSQEAESHSRNKSQSYASRANSQPFVFEIKEAEIVEDKEGESQTHRNLSGSNDSHLSQTIVKKDDHPIERDQSQSGSGYMNYRPTTDFHSGFRSEKLVRPQQHLNSNECSIPNKAYQEDIASKRLRENWRKNLLGNIKKAKTQKGSLLTEADTHIMSASVKKWPEIPQPAILEQEPTKWKNSARVLKKAKRTKKQSKNLTSDQVMTEMDYESYLKELQEDKVPIKEEMQDLLSKYGYKNAMVDTKSFSSNRVLKKSQHSSLLQDSLNKEKLKKIDKFLKQTSFKTTKAIKVD